ncbi:TylF/MycF family methyltransferase [Patescibacteria group bacterium]|nr:TylF/MycF family methyltransferase [Patescibacteria group bacterium]
MIIKEIIKYLFRKVGYELRKIDVRKKIWEVDENFIQLYRIIESDTSVSVNRCFMIYQYARQVKDLGGEVAEFGVYKGGTAKLIAEIFKEENKIIYLFDTFSGMPETDKDIDLHQQGDFADVSLKEVKNYLKNYNNLEFCEGYFPEITLGLKDKKFCFVYIDVDIYKSIKDGLEFFYNRMVKGGVIVIDDYEGKNCPGVKKAIDIFIEGKYIYPIITTEAQCILIKK